MTEHQSGPEVGEEWAEEDTEYGELLRVARAVEEARREIDLRAVWVKAFANNAAKLLQKARKHVIN
jgi:hypothetical protein